MLPAFRGATLKLYLIFAIYEAILGKGLIFQYKLKFLLFSSGMLVPSKLFNFKNDNTLFNG